MVNEIDLRQNVLNELRWDVRFDATHIAVTTDGGTVTLTGHVSSYPAIFQVRDAVRRVQGVKAIADELTLQLPSEDYRDDTEIAKSICHLLEHNGKTANTNVKVIVSEGSVELTGDVQWQHERQYIEDQVSHVRGVNNIRNCITLRQQLAPDNIREQIESALARNAELEAEHINISVDGDQVTLSGRVRAFYERNLVESAVWHAPGVHKVIDKIEVG